MARDDEGREIDDTTIIAGGQHAWSEVDRPDTEPNPPADEAPTQLQERVDPGEPEAVPRTPSGDDPGVERPDYATALPTESAAPTEPPGPILPPGPVLVASGLGLLTKSGWVFKDIDLTLPPASVAAIVGPSGTGRSCLLLTLSGRMEPNTGTLTVAGHSSRDKSANIRALTAVARIGSLITPEPGLTVRESIIERCLLDDVDTTIGRARFNEACAALQVTFEPTAMVGTLIGQQATLFAVALACVRVSAVIVLDDLDRGVSAAMQQTMLDALIRLAETGPTVVVSTTDRIPVMEADVVLDLTPQDGAMVWKFEPAAALPVGGVLAHEPLGEPSSPVPPQLGPGDPYGPGPQGEPGRQGGPGSPYGPGPQEGPGPEEGPGAPFGPGQPPEPGPPRPAGSDQISDAPTEDLR